MDLKVNSVKDLLKTNICRCCLKEYKNGTKENSPSWIKMYEDMLKNTFNIQLSQQDIDGYFTYICEECIIKIQNGLTFKQMVLHNEQNFIKLVERLKCTNREIKTLDDGVKVDDIKAESSPIIDQYEDSYDDNVILANVKKELRQSNTTEINTNYQNNSKVNKIKKCKISTKLADQKDWSKIIERRGNGPILRENSLKLLANSSIFPFQWNKSRYRCFCCKEPFSDVNSLREHTNNEHTLKNIEKKIINQQNRLVKVEISDLKCTLCNLTLNNLQTLRDHLTDSHHISFQSKEDLLVPFKIGGELTCQICNENFIVFRLLNIHMNKHYQKQVCHICGAGFSNLVFLNLHKTRTHKPIKCRHCDTNFSNKIDKKTHEIDVHNVKYERKLRFPCPYCNERFYQENFRVQHLVEKHDLKRPEFKCDICCKIFITKSLRNNHLKNVHLKAKNHECDVCHNFFYTKSDVVRHKVTHTGEKKYACTLCNNPFASKDSLRRHMKRTHSMSH